MRNLFAMLCIALGVNAFAATGDAQQPADAIKRFIDSFDKGDIAAAEATHAADVVIIDEVEPYVWQGRDAFKHWLADLEKHDTAGGVTDGNVKLGETLREEITGDTAYVVMATDYTFKQKGVAMKEPSQMTFALRKERDGWRIAGWTFAGPKPKP